ncbi:hypothetical protein ACQ9BO_18760 [Flavobacterium sp. P21]|uniref:hypothetical protein n=1 Tax=Flavobacterium sp. P21 TaxID=3423948 RepID=UPI003D673DC6
MRKLKNTYSYIPLHFMAEYAIAKNVPFDNVKLEIDKYSISNDALLMRVKKRLRDYVLGNGKPYAFKWFGEIHEKYKSVHEGDRGFGAYQEELQEQKDLRELRNKYLHWSADCGSLGMEPAKNRKRKTF